MELLPLPLTFLFLISMPLLFQCFNINTENVTVKSGPKGTQFGFTTRFLPTVGGKLRLVVGAPSASTPNGDPTTGTIHLCEDLLNKQETCSKTMYFDDGMNLVNSSAKERFGSSVAVTSSGLIMVCSPRWKDTNPVNKDFIFMPGRCSLYNINTDRKEKEFKPYFHVGSDRNKYVVKLGKTSEYYHGLASYGFSSDSDEDSVFVVGAPGILMFEGNIRIQDEKTGEVTEIATQWENKLDTTAYGYLGYSLKMGKFCNGSDICLAVGAPNQNRVGNVYIYKWQNKRSLETIQLIKGLQAWSFFGHTVGAIDVNGDGFHELLVGAPHFTDVNNAVDGFDQGRVYVYTRTPAVQTLVSSVTLSGGQGRYARFGTAIGAIGDINLDGFLDVAVGAPGEDDGAGSIYIYLGGRAGLITTPSQKITASQISAGLKGIGFAFSNHASQPSSNYGVFTTSSVVDDTIAIFQMRPVVHAEAQLRADPNPVNIEIPCTQSNIAGACIDLKFCMNYTIRGESKRRLNFQIGLDIDVQVRLNLKRALFRQTDGKLVEKIPMTNYPMQADGRCIHYTVVMRESQVNQDRFNPVEIVATFKLDDDKPILDALQPNNVSLLVTFVNKCGGDNICDVDLGVSGDVDYTHTGEWQKVVVNHTKELMVNVEVTNSMDTSYWTVVTVEVDSALPFRRFASDVSVNCQAAQESAADPLDTAVKLLSPQKSVVKCNYYKPLEKGSSIGIMMAFGTENLDLTKRILKIQAEAMPQNKVNNPEKKPEDNKVDLTATVAIIPDVSVEGSSSPVEVTLTDAKRLSLTSNNGYLDGFHKSENTPDLMNVTNKILVRNNGPSFLPETTVNISVPMFLVDGTPLVHKAEVKLTTADGKAVRCRETVKFQYLQDVKTTTPSTVETSTSSSITRDTQNSTDTVPTTVPTTTDGWNPEPPVNRRKRDTNDNARVLDTIYTVSCSLNKDLCQVFVCDLESTLAPNSHAEINVALELDKANVPIPKDFHTCYFVTDAEVNEPDHPLFVPWDRPRTVHTLTKFHLVQSGGKINIWIIIGSIIAGLVLITIIVIICWKMGFFKRRKHHEVEQWRRESVRRSRKVNPKETDQSEKSGAALNAATSASDEDL